MLALVLAVAAAAAPPERPVAVVATSKRPGADAYTQAMAERVHGALVREGVPGLLPLEEGARQLVAAGITDPRSCQAARACVGKLALILGRQGVVVSVDTARAGGALAVVLEAVSGDGARVLASSEATLPVGAVSDAAALPIVLFARTLKERLEAEAPKAPAPEPDQPKVADAPTRPRLEPPVEQVRPLAAPPPSPGRRAAAWTLAGTAVLAAGAAVALGAVSASARWDYDRSLTTLPTGERASTLPRSQVETLAARANGTFYGALGAGGGAVALGVASAVLFLTNP